MTNLTNKLAEDETVIEIITKSRNGEWGEGKQKPTTEMEIVRTIIHTYEAKKEKLKEEKYKLAREEFWKAPPLWPIEKTLGMKQSDYEKIMMQGEWPTESPEEKEAKRLHHQRLNRYAAMADAMSGRRPTHTLNDDMVDAFRYAMQDIKPPKPFTFWQKIKRLFRSK